MQAKCKAGEIIITRERLDSQGYAKGGRYFGVGSPLFSVIVETDDGRTIYGHVRAPGARQLAKILRECDADETDVENMFASGLVGLLTQR